VSVLHQGAVHACVAGGPSLLWAEVLHLGTFRSRMFGMCLEGSGHKAAKAVVSGLSQGTGMWQAVLFGGGCHYQSQPRHVLTLTHSGPRGVMGMLGAWALNLELSVHACRACVESGA